MARGKNPKVAKARKAAQFKGRDLLKQDHKIGLDDGKGTTYITRHLRSGVKAVPVVIRSKGFRQNPNMLVPLLPERSTKARKGMTDEHTRMIVGVGASTGNFTQQRAAARATDWNSVASADEMPEFQLRQAGLARCHILADSRIAVIVPKMVGRVAAQNPGGIVQPPPAVTTFFTALMGPRTELAATHFVTAVNQAVSGNLSSFQVAVVVNALSLGENNLYLGDATRNGDISNGFDMVFDEAGNPEPRAVRIRDAVIGLAAHGHLDLMTAMNATTPTRDRRTGLAVTSSERGHYDPMEQVDWSTTDRADGKGSNESPF